MTFKFKEYTGQQELEKSLSWYYQSRIIAIDMGDLRPSVPTTMAITPA